MPDITLSLENTTLGVHVIRIVGLNMESIQRRRGVRTIVTINTVEIPQP